MPDWVRVVLIGIGLWTGVSILSGAVYVWCAMRWRNRP